MNSVLYYVHDPMCSWCWGYRPTWRRLRASLPDSIVVQNVLGGLAPDSDEPMSASLQSTIQAHWKRIASELGTEFNFEFWARCQPRRSTFPACRAVLAARQQQREEDMILAIQKAYYLRAMNPSDTEILITLGGELGLDTDRFASDLASCDVDKQLSSELSFARTLPIRGFPSLVLEARGIRQPITLDYADAQTALNSIASVKRATESDRQSV